MASQYGKMKTTLCDYLTRENCKKIMMFLDWPSGKQDSVTNAAALLDKLQAEDIISDGNYGKLIDILEALSLKQAANIVRKFVPERHPVQATD